VWLLGRNYIVAVVVGLLLGACGGTMSLTEYAEALETAAATASSRFDSVNATLNSADSTLEDAQLAAKDAAVIGSDLLADLEALDPPGELAELHALLLELDREVVAAQQVWAESADRAQSVADVVQSPEAQAMFRSNESALAACRRIQDALDATVEGAVFDDTPWIPSELKESISVALGCAPGSNG
jgi:hypothetical protein